MLTESKWPDIAAICLAAITVALILWDRKKSKNSEIRRDRSIPEYFSRTVCSTCSIRSKESDNVVTVPELPNPKWVKVGEVKELYIYPLKSGKGQSLKECEFTEYGIREKEENRLALRDRMFLLYDENIKHFQTIKNFPKLILVNLTAVDKSTIKLEAKGIPDITVKIDEQINKKREKVKIKTWFSEEMNCIDCGEKPAKWLSNFLLGKSSGLRLGYTVDAERNILRGPWERFYKVYKTMREKDVGLFADLTSYMMVTSQSIDELNKKLEKPVPAVQLRPNIVISADKPFAEDTWEWIKIGKTVIRNVKPCTRCSMITYDPETGEQRTGKDNPLSVLQRFRQQTDPQRIAVDGKSPLMGVYCGLYLPGDVKIGEEVFVHIEKSPRTFDDWNLLNKLI